MGKVTSYRGGAPERGLASLLRLVTVIQPQETTKALLLTLNSFLLIFGYYQIKAAREGLLLAAHPASVKAYLAIPQVLLLVPVIWVFSHLASRVPRHLLITWVTLFCISNLLLFCGAGWFGAPVAVTGIVFFVWIGIYNLIIPAQFWGFANDIYSEAEGKRLFPLIALGASLGGVAGPMAARLLIPVIGSYAIMLVTAATLCGTIALTWMIHARDLRDSRDQPTAAYVARESPLDPGDGLQLVLRSRYLLLIAAMVMVYNFVNAVGEFMFSDLQRQVALREVGPQGSIEDIENYIGAAFAGYQGLGNMIGLTVQFFLVSRLFRWLGIGGALLVLPLVALGGYGFATLGASLLLLKWLKATENGVDYSLMKTARSALFLVTPRRDKYKAQAAIETIFVRAGDVLAAAMVWLGTAFMPLTLEGFAAVNVGAVCLWILLSVWISLEREQLQPAAGVAGASVAGHQA